MQTAETTGQTTRTTDHVSNTNNRCQCGAEADGVDARSRKPICSDCAADSYCGKQFICDGGTSWVDLTGFQRDLLLHIYQLDQPSGQDIQRSMQATYVTINHGRLYPNLNTLVENDLVEKGEQNQRTNFYQINDQGRRLIETQAQAFASATSEPMVADGGQHE